MSSNSTNTTEKEKAGQQTNLWLPMIRGWHLGVQADKVSSNSTNTTEKEKAGQQTERLWHVGLATTVVATAISL